MKSPEVWARSSDREGGKESRWREGLGEGEGYREREGGREEKGERWRKSKKKRDGVRERESERGRDRESERERGMEGVRERNGRQPGFHASPLVKLSQSLGGIAPAAKGGLWFGGISWLGGIFVPC